MNEMKPTRLSPYWLWQNCIPDKVLDVLKTEIDNATLEPGIIVAGHKPNVRNSNVVLTHGNHWFAGIMSNLAVSSNRAAQWGYDITHCEMLQIAQYEKDQFFDWHIDTDILGLQPEQRKLTTICLLSDPDEDFVGGELEIKHIEMPRLTRGSVIVFPSILEHRVTPITSGVRYSATSWSSGPRFK